MTARNSRTTHDSHATRRPIDPATPQKSHLRLTRRGRAVLATLGALPIVAGAFVFGLNGGGAVASADQSGVEFQYVTVRAGESLWSLAEELAPESDPRDVVDDILSLNQLPSAGIEPGQRLAVPSQYDVVR
ncbi:LysM peptidoglycan-binding domain-containing protein [Rathayibacter sp. VKM Ac-2759]|uniref:LysM peptidoglycan-binding domain-containing protein n=1 Tax=Rathayibacter sp. VKM Ac-2759 TaxID=2609252 RepID=UPI0013166D21|nr:LysM peptidoglycan-binding domain-containing protein [Rathayibacter sp. VKM Ac-2759]QHC66316.1 LysM peptidoglycan-binding domain-containing protein [Rathayibacter sp. VKM Ac-2759]